MTDLNRTDATLQPTTIPILSTDGETYTAPGEDWDGAPTRAPLSSGAEAAGISPNDYFNGQMFNDVAGRLGQGLATILDSAAATWSPATVVGLDTNEWGNSTLRRIVVAPGYYYSGIWSEILAEAAADSGAGGAPFNFRICYDGEEWGPSHDTGLDVSDTPRGLIVGSSVISSVRYVTHMVWGEAAHLVRGSDNMGSTWYDIAAYPVAMETIGAYGFFNGRFFLCSRSYLSWIDHATFGAWTRIDTASLGWNGAPPVSALGFFASPYECAIGIAGQIDLIHSDDGNTFVAAPLPTADDGVKHAHWSEAHQKWIILSNTNNRVLSAPRGFGSYTELPQILDANGTAVTPLETCSLGRTIVANCGTSGLWATRDLQTWRNLSPRIRFDNTESGTTGWRWLRQLGGRLWAAYYHRISTTGGNGGLAYTMSAALPSEFIRNGGTY